MKGVLLLLLVHGALAASPFSGFFVGGGLGWDWFRVHEQRRFEGVDPFFAISNGSGDGFLARGYVGWMRDCTLFRLGARLGYQGLFDDKLFGMPLFQSPPTIFNRANFSKDQGAFLDVMPAIFLCDCWFLHVLLGVGYTQYHYAGFEVTGRLFRDQKVWAFLPRLGAGLQWNFCRCLSAGFEWSYNFPGNAIYYGPKEGPSELDGNTRKEKVRGNQLALTLNWWFL